MLKEMGGIKEALRFPQKLNVVSKGYHGKVFEGNACKTMIKQAHRMLDKGVLGDVLSMCSLMLELIRQWIKLFINALVLGL